MTAVRMRTLAEPEAGGRRHKFRNVNKVKRENLP